ncbi:MAG: hypothetical protein PVJ09_04100 [Candidatus Woesebacteria bacterium]|jgi:hypothetical protein
MLSFFGTKSPPKFTPKDTKDTKKLMKFVKWFVNNTSNGKLLIDEVSRSIFASGIRPVSGTRNTPNLPPELDTDPYYWFLERIRLSLIMISEREENDVNGVISLMEEELARHTAELKSLCEQYGVVFEGTDVLAEIEKISNDIDRKWFKSKLLDFRFSILELDIIKTLY